MVSSSPLSLVPQGTPCPSADEDLSRAQPILSLSITKTTKRDRYSDIELPLKVRKPIPHDACEGLGFRKMLCILATQRPAPSSPSIKGPMSSGSTRFPEHILALAVGFGIGKASRGGYEVLRNVAAGHIATNGGQWTSAGRKSES